MGVSIFLLLRVILFPYKIGGGLSINRTTTAANTEKKKIGIMLNRGRVTK